MVVLDETANQLVVAGVGCCPMIIRSVEVYNKRSPVNASLRVSPFDLDKINALYGVVFCIITVLQDINESIYSTIKK